MQQIRRCRWRLADRRADLGDRFSHPQVFGDTH
jgi:hypothetical protein